MGDTPSQKDFCFYMCVWDVVHGEGCHHYMMSVPRLDGGWGWSVP